MFPKMKSLTPLSVWSLDSTLTNTSAKTAEVKNNRFCFRGKHLDRIKINLFYFLLSQCVWFENGIPTLVLCASITALKIKVVILVNHNHEQSASVPVILQYNQMSYQTFLVWQMWFLGVCLKYVCRDSMKDSVFLRTAATVVSLWTDTRGLQAANQGRDSTWWALHTFCCSKPPNVSLTFYYTEHLKSQHWQRINTHQKSNLKCIPGPFFSL